MFVKLPQHIATVETRRLKMYVGNLKPVSGGNDTIAEDVSDYCTEQYSTQTHLLNVRSSQSMMLTVPMKNPLLFSL